MSIVKRGPDAFLIRVYLGRDPITKKRIDVNETVRGPFSLARKREAQLKGLKVSGGLAKTEKLSVNDLLDLYLLSYRHIHKESTQHKNKKYLDYYVRGYIGRTLLKDIKHSDIQNLFNSLLDKGFAPSTVRSVKKVLRGAFNFGVDDKRIAENPVSKTKLPPINKSSADSMTHEEAAAFTAVKSNHHYGNAFVFQLHTGLRPQELLALTWDDIDFEKGTVRIERACQWVDEQFIGFGPPKTKLSARTIELSSEIMELLRLHFANQQKIISESNEHNLMYGELRVVEWIIKERPKSEHLYPSMNLVFPDCYGRVPRAVIPRLEFKAMLREAGITRVNFRWYDLRHTHATLLLMDEVPPHEVAERMGHTTQMLLSTYTHVLPQRRRAAATSFQRLVPV